jgi:hypothetical protein
MDEHVGAAEPGGDVRHAAEQVDALAASAFELGALRPFAEDDEVRVGISCERADRDVDALLRLEPADREQHGASGGTGRRVRAPRRGSSSSP